MGESIPIKPSSFAIDAGLLDLSMEEVVALFIDKEKRRHKDAKDDENQQEAYIGSRVVPTGLLMSLDTVCRHCDISRSLLTRCLSHQIMAWYDSIPRLKELSELFYIVCDAADDFGYPDLYDGMQDVGYTLGHISPKHISFRTINWVKNSLYVKSKPLGLSAGLLFVIGLCRSVITTASGRSQGTIEKYLSEEVSRLEIHIEERFFRVFSFHDTVRRRAKLDGRGVISPIVTKVVSSGDNAHN